MNVVEAVVGKCANWLEIASQRSSKSGIHRIKWRGGLGWLEGFNEMVTRCGYEWVLPPGMDKGVLLPLHGLAANIPEGRAEH